MPTAFLSLHYTLIDIVYRISLRGVAKMLSFESFRVMSSVPHITNEALDEYAEAVIRDFAPERLNIPGPFDVESFVRDYLGLSVELHKLKYERETLGLTVFEDGHIRASGSDGVETVPVTAGTVIIDSSLEIKRNAARRRFTYAHEGSHWLIHRTMFLQETLFRIMGGFDSQRIAAKQGRVDYSRSRTDKTDTERAERQADFLASALLMPLPALRRAFSNFFVAHGGQSRKIVRGSSPADNEAAIRLVEYVSRIFEVSKRAALIRLEKLNVITDYGDGVLSGAYDF
jgi:Zn-dependent peptidase ImmA (M78 family)